MIATMQVRPDKMLSSTDRGFIAATEIADYLARKGVPFRQAHQTVKEIVLYCVEHKKTLPQLTDEEFVRFSDDIKPDVRKYIQPAVIVAAKTSVGGTAPASVKKQIKELEAKCR
jgi:argininosuccinate lyase